MPLLSDLTELKTLLDIDKDDKSEDKKLYFFLDMASGWISEMLNRPGLFVQARTEFYSGSGTQKLLLRSRPVYPTPTIVVNVDDSGYWGSRSGSFNTANNLTYGSDFALQLEPGEEGLSRSGILLRIGAYWPKLTARQAGLLTPFVTEGFGNVKVTYTAGYTVDNLPSPLRLACNTLVAELRVLFPLGFLSNSEGYEDRSVSVQLPQKDYLLAMIRPMVMPYRNQRW